MVFLINMLLAISIFAHPFIQIQIPNPTPIQGEAVWITILSAKELATGSVNLNGKSFTVFKQSNQTINNFEIIFIFAWF